MTAALARVSVTSRMAKNGLHSLGLGADQTRASSSSTALSRKSRCLPPAPVYVGDYLDNDVLPAIERWMIRVFLRREH